MSRSSHVPGIQRIEQNPAHWPRELLPMFEQALTCEFASLTRRAVPITLPLTPYIGPDEMTLDVSTGLTYPAKAERVRRNPKVALLYSDPVSTNLERPPVILIYGFAAVRDADIQANTDRYLALSLSKSPAGFKGTPTFVLRRLPWYFARIWIQVVPMKILWWPQGDTNMPPLEWHAPADVQPRTSDPAPRGRQLPPWKDAPTDWRKNAVHAVKALGLPIVTTVDADGFPVPVRVKQVSLTADGFALQMPIGTPAITSGSGCLTFHAHPHVFSGQENKIFLGDVSSTDDAIIHFKVERPLADWSLPGSQLTAAFSFFENGRKLMSRLRVEAERRGQPVPTVRIPSFW